MRIFKHYLRRSCDLSKKNPAWEKPCVLRKMFGKLGVHRKSIISSALSWDNGKLSWDIFRAAVGTEFLSPYPLHTHTHGDRHTPGWPGYFVEYAFARQSRVVWTIETFVEWTAALCFVWTSSHCKAYPFGMHPFTGDTREKFFTFCSVKK